MDSMKFARFICAPLFLICLTFFILTPKTYAATTPIEIECDTRNCTPSTIPSLFPASSFLYAPGREQSSQLRVTNSAQTTVLTLAGSLRPIKSSQSTCAIEQYMQLSATRSDGGRFLANAPIKALATGQARFELGQIQPRSTHLYTFTLKMSDATPNECQGASGIFDVQLRLEQGGPLETVSAPNGEVLGAQTAATGTTAAHITPPPSCAHCVWWPFYLLQVGAYVLFAAYVRAGKLSLWYSPHIAICTNLLFLMFHGHCLQVWHGIRYVYSATNPLCPLMIFWSVVMLICFLISWYGFIKKPALPGRD